MSYTKTTDFLAKDSLLTGNPAKKVKGSEIDTEFNNIATADADNVKSSALGTGVATALAVNVGSAGAPVLFNGAGGTPSSLVGTNITGTAAGLTAGVASAVAVGGITGLGTGVGTALAVNVGSAGAPVVNGGALGTPSSGNLANCTGAGVTVQVAEATPVTVATTCSTQIPLDDTIPQNTEGDEVITVAITPTSATNRLRIEFDAPVVANGANNVSFAVALFQDTTANALAAGAQGASPGGTANQLRLTHEMAAGTTSATTFKIRCGPCSATSLVLNAGTGGAGTRVFGGVAAIRLRVTEIKV